MLNKLSSMFLSLFAFVFGVKAEQYFEADLFYAAPATFIAYDTAVKTGIIQERVDIDYGIKIYKDRVNIAPMTYIMDNLRSRPAKTTTVKGFEQRSAGRFVTAVGTFGSAANSANSPATLTLSSNEVKSIQVYQTFEITGTTIVGASYTKYCYVSAKPTSTTITLYPVDKTKILRPSNSLATWASGTKLFKTGTMFGQNDRSVEAVTNKVNVIQNVTQIFRNPYELSESARMENLYANETERNRLMEEARFEHLLGIEAAHLFNGPMVLDSETSTPTVQRGYMQGLEYDIKTNSPHYTVYNDPVDFMDAYDSWQFGLFSPRIIDGNMYKRFLICNKAMRKFFHNLKEQKPGIEIGANGTYGIDGIDTIKLDNGYSFDAFLHPMVDEKYPDDDKPYGMALHLAYIENKPYRKTRLKANIQYNDQDGLKDEFLTETTHLMYLPELAGVIEYEAA